ncbi:MAG: head-tail adaptor protein [Clostridia bacterium]|nr:head-tail adaptor protein [Clostridia bacterium]
MSEFKPATPFNVPGQYFKCTETMVKGTLKKVYDEIGTTFYCSFRSFGGTERENNGITVVEDTATIETWYDPNLTTNCKVVIGGVNYEILGTPENVAMRNKWLRFKVRAIRGGA